MLVLRKRKLNHPCVVKPFARRRKVSLYFSHACFAVNGFVTRGKNRRHVYNSVECPIDVVQDVRLSIYFIKHPIVSVIKQFTIVITKYFIIIIMKYFIVSVIKYFIIIPMKYSIASVIKQFVIIKVYCIEVSFIKTSIDSKFETVSL